VKVVGTHPGLGLIGLAVVAFLGSHRFVGAFLVVYEVAAILHEDLVAALRAASGVHVVPHLALQAHVGNEAVHGFRVHARQVSSVGVAVGVAVRNIEKEHEVVTAVSIGMGSIIHRISLPVR